jgi:hypothetical protein
MLIRVYKPVIVHERTGERRNSWSEVDDILVSFGMQACNPLLPSSVIH